MPQGYDTRGAGGPQPSCSTPTEVWAWTILQFPSWRWSTERQPGLEPPAAGQLDGRPVDDPADVTALEGQQLPGFTRLPPPSVVSGLKDLDPEAPLVRGDQHPGALAERGDQLPGEPEHGRLVGRAVTHSKGPVAVPEPLQHPAQRRPQPGCLLVDEPGVDRPHRRQVAAVGLLGDRPPAGTRPSGWPAGPRSRPPPGTPRPARPRAAARPRPPRRSARPRRCRCAAATPRTVPSVLPTARSARHWSGRTRRRRSRTPADGPRSRHAATHTRPPWPPRRPARPAGSRPRRAAPGSPPSCPARTRARPRPRRRSRTRPAPPRPWRTPTQGCARRPGLASPIPGRSAPDGQSTRHAAGWSRRW